MAPYQLIPVLVIVGQRVIAIEYSTFSKSQNCRLTIRCSLVLDLGYPGEGVILPFAEDTVYYKPYRLKEERGGWVDFEIYWSHVKMDTKCPSPFFVKKSRRLLAFWRNEEIKGWKKKGKRKKRKKIKKKRKKKEKRRKKNEKRKNTIK